MRRKRVTSSSLLYVPVICLCKLHLSAHVLALTVYMRRAHLCGADEVLAGAGTAGLEDALPAQSVPIDGLR